ncbi:MAG: antibiotic biosynthesis monooxygenase [Candidatus Cybelea sp.]
MSENVVHFLIAARPRAGAEAAFSQWASRLQKAALDFQGSLSCELWPPTPPDQEEWVAVMRFATLDALRSWRVSENHRALIAEAQPLVEGGRVIELTGGAATEFYVQNSATEVIVTEVKPGRENDYRDWANRIDKLESGFPGFRGSYMQPPASGETAWTTLLRFDTIEKLNAWLESPARATLLKDAEELVDRVLAHRVDTSFPGWVPVSPVTGKPPNMWKTAALVLLGLFPVVMLELKFVMPHLRGLGALGTFIGNAISVGLTTWPLMPIAIRAFHGWLFPESAPRWVVIWSPVILLACYAIELLIFWRLL